MKKEYTWDDFVEIIERLRAKDGCPWDREQTHESLKRCMIEECYEVIEAIDNKDMLNLREELGDVLLQVVMHGVIAKEEQAFTLDDVLQEVSEKMIRRHPHVFGDVTVNNSEDVLENWDEIKKQEKNQETVVESIKRIPKALPANLRAEKVQNKAAKVGFEFENYDQVLAKVYEELEELQEARQKGNFTHVQEEFGDLMFAIVNLSRFLQVNAENSLTNATDKFINRFEGVEGLAKKQNKTLEMLSIQQLDLLWEEIKQQND